MALRREPTRKRRAPTREPRHRILIVCGADKTESAYFKGLRDFLRAATVSVTVVEKGRRAPDQVVDYARLMSADQDYDEVWCVVDVDDFERDGGKISLAGQLGKRHGIELAVSNPCFELWLLLHHADCTSHCATCRVAEGLLRKRLPAYAKENLIFKDFAGKVRDAVERARKLDPSGAGHAINPSTGVWRLVGVILAQK